MPRTRNLYDPNCEKPYRLSRSRIENFMRCPRCFYIDRKLGIDVPSGPPFTLNIAVDTLLKKEFDVHRENGTPHPYMIDAGIDAVPAIHPMLDDWRKNFVGIRYLHTPTNLEIQGAIDDLWIGPDGKYIVADYKATAKKSEINLDADWQISYKRQMEVYQWLLRKNGLDVSNESWFVYCNGQLDNEGFNGKIDFTIHMLPYIANDDWVEDAIIAAAETLKSDTPPVGADDCKLCTYRQDVISIGM